MISFGLNPGPGFGWENHLRRDACHGNNGCFFGRTLVWSMTLISPNISMMVGIGWLYYKTFGSNPPWEITRRIKISPTCPTILWTSKTAPGSVASLTHPTSQACGRRAKGTGIHGKYGEMFLEALFVFLSGHTQHEVGKLTMDEKSGAKQWLILLMLNNPCTSWYGKYPIIYKVFKHPTGG